MGHTPTECVGHKLLASRARESFEERHLQGLKANLVLRCTETDRNTCTTSSRNIHTLRKILELRENNDHQLYSRFQDLLHT